MFRTRNRRTRKVKRSSASHGGRYLLLRGERLEDRQLPGSILAACIAPYFSCAAGEFAASLERLSASVEVSSTYAVALTSLADPKPSESGAVILAGSAPHAELSDVARHHEFLPGGVVIQQGAISATAATAILSLLDEFGDSLFDPDSSLSFSRTSQDAAGFSAIGAATIGAEPRTMPQSQPTVTPLDVQGRLRRMPEASSSANIAALGWNADFSAACASSGFDARTQAELSTTATLSPAVQHEYQAPTPAEEACAAGRWLVFGEAEVHHDYIELGIAGRGEQASQPKAVHAASILLEPAASYDVSYFYDFKSWDSNAALGMGDVFRVNVTSQPFAQLSYVTMGIGNPAWSGATANDGVLSSASGSQAITFAGNPNGDNYLNFVLDTRQSSMSMPSPPVPPYTPQPSNPSWGTIAVTVLPTVANGPPHAENDAYWVAHDTTLVIDSPGVLANDYDCDGDTLTVTGVTTQPALGTVAMTGGGGFAYSPFSGVTGQDSFQYAITDGELNAVGTVYLDITNNAPGAVDDEYYVHSTPLIIDAYNGVLRNDWDRENDPLVVQLHQPPQFGALTLNTDGSFVYVGTPGVSLIDTFRYVITDGVSFSTAALVTLNMKPVNLDIWHGQQDLGDFAVPDEKDGHDTDPTMDGPGDGAFTAANWNDTDGDGIDDWTDTLVDVPASTSKVTQPATAGATTITLDSVEGFVVGQTVRLWELLDLTGKQEDRQIAAIDEANKRLTFSQPLEHDYLADKGRVQLRGRGEVDLMRLRIHKPKLMTPGTSATLQIVSGDVALWKQSHKGEGNQVSFVGGSVQIPMGDFGADGYIDWFVEAQSPSTVVRDIALKFSYGVDVDVVRATAVWANVAWEDDARTADELFAPGTPWEDAEAPVTTSIHNVGGTGLRPVNAETGVRNALLIRFTVSPSGVFNEGVLQFDATRQLEQGSWCRANAADPWTPAFTQQPRDVERPNDDAKNDDESGSLSDNDHFFVMDAPGIVTNRPTDGDVERVYKTNFWEWLRVAPSARPSYNVTKESGVVGTRVSPIVTWHESQELIVDSGVWTRTTGDTEVLGRNDVDVESGHIPLTLE